ncbi:MAG TPA: ABC transporter permease, partial [Bryobacteraceae bacterium]|nr:ABC transporter permease [Bryobacteraceae bacterium]
MLTDLKYALRQLRKNPGFTLIVVLTLALGIGANTAAFTAINALLLRPLPVRDPAQLVLLARTADEMNPYRFSYPFFQKLRAESKSLSELIATNDSSGDFVATGFGSNQLERVALSQVSGNYFSFFGLSPALGRLLTPDDDRAGAPRNVAVISYRLWQNRFAGDPGVLGKSIQVGPAAFIIVGVAPNGFTGLRVGADTGLWLPLQTITQVDPSAAVRLQSTNASTWLSLIGRLGAGVSRSAAQSETAVIFARIQREVAARLGPTWSPTDRRKFLDDRAVLEAGSSGFNNARYSMPMIIILSTIVVLVFLVACANASGLLLARGSVRQRELGVRLA